MTEQSIIIGGVSTGLILLIALFIRLRSVIATVVTDTLKREGKWSATKLTMATAWLVVLYSYHYDLIKNGFNETAFSILVGVALGAKVTDAFSKKLDPTVTAPDSQTTIKQDTTDTSSKTTVTEERI